MPSVRFSELHYDNTGTDAGERIEISGPAGTDVTGWQVVLYNGNGGASYNSQTLSGAIPATCGARGVIVLSYPVNGIQNGGSGIATEPDGMALVNNSGAVVEFLSYEGSFAATNGPAAGTTSTNIGAGVGETGSEPVGQSLKRGGNGIWTGPTAESFGTCNDENEEPPPPPAEVATVTIDPSSATVVQGGTQQFTASAVDAAGQPVAGVTFTWSTPDGSLAEVTSSGLATGRAAGDARIIVSSPNGRADTASLHITAPTPGLPSVRFSELHYDNAGGDVGEAIELEGPAGTNLTGWSVVLYNFTGGAVYNTRALTATIPAQCNGRGVVTLDYPADGIQNGPQDGFALVDAGGNIVEFLSYEGVLTATNGPAAGRTSTDIGVSEATSSPIGQSLQRNASGVWSGPVVSTFGSCNGAGDPPPPPANNILFTGRTPSDPALPVGFQDQLFATLRDANNTTIPSTATWLAETPAIASIDQNGVITSLAAGSATFRATMHDGTTATWTLPTRVAVPSTTALYEGNAEFGEPTDANASDDFIVRRAQYTASYNRIRGTPNWVSYDLEATHFGPEDRCDCFTTDPLLPSSFPSYTTADYTGAGTFHGYGIDRGHLARSFDRTSASLDNATTFYFSNIIPQAADLNQGPWANMENDLGNLARFENKEVYIIAGPAGSKGTIKNEGKITIPTSVWKVAVIMPRDQGLEDVDDVSDLEIIAVIAPNEPGVRNVDWKVWKTTVDAVEALSGYDLLALLRDDIEIAAESGTRRPNAAVDGPYTSTEGSAVPMSAAGSTDPDGDALTYAWSFGDGGVASGAVVSHTYAQDGAYTVRLIATDIRGLADTVTTTASVANVAPVFAPATGATIDHGDTYSSSGSFTDPGADSFTGTVDYGDGSGVRSLTLSGKSFTLSHRYVEPGTYTVTVRIADDDASATQTRTIRVLSTDEVIGSVAEQIEQLAASGRVPSGFANSVTTRLESMMNRLDQHSDKTVSVVMQLVAMNNQIDGMVRSGQMSAADAAVVRAAIARVMKVVQG
jgi:DNA/RNA endonuclease G (NUC1)